MVHSQTALEIYQSSDEAIDREVIGQVLMGIAFAQYKLTDHSDAAASAIQAYEILNEISSPRAGTALRNAGVFYQEAKRFSESAEIFRIAIKIPLIDDEELTLAEDFYNLGFALVKLEQFNEAINLLSQSRVLASKLTTPIIEALCSEQLAFCYAVIGEYEKSLECVKFAIDYAVLSGNDKRMYESVKIRGKIHLAQKDYDSAISDFKAAKIINIEHSCITNWDEIYELEEQIASIHDLRGENEEAQEIRRRIKTVSKN